MASLIYKNTMTRRVPVTRSYYPGTRLEPITRGYRVPAQPYRALLQQWEDKFDPELVIVSAGYDCAIGCPEGEMKVTPACFSHFVNLLTPLASGKLALILEGGYNIKSLSESVALSLRALLGDPTPCIQPIRKPKCSVLESVLNAIKVLHPYWQSLAFQDFLPLKSLLLQNHPFPRILQDPPVEGVMFYTADNHPETFPLIQECFGEGAMQNMDLLNQDIEVLIQNTPLLSFQYCLGLCSDHRPSTNIIHSSLCQSLKSSNLMNQCLSEIAIPDTKPSIQKCIHGAVDAVLSGKTQSCLTLISGSSSRAQSEVIEECEECTGIGSAVQQAFNTHSVDRILVVRMSRNPSSDTSLEDLKSVLQVNVTWPDLKEATPVAGPQESSFNSSVPEHVSSCERSVDIEFQKLPLVSGDIVAAFHQVILPVSYEFCPDLVIFSWERQTYSNTDLPIGLLGHISQYLHGLANGRLLILADGFGLADGTDANDIDQLLSCCNVLLGQNCVPIGSSVPSKSGIQAIRKTLDEIKDHWSMITFQQPVPKLEI